MNDKSFKKIFIAHKVNVPDNGFSERVIRRLPKRNNVLPQIIMVTFIVIGLAFIFAIHGFANILEQINSMLVSVSQLQVPSLSSIILCICVLALTVFIGFSVAQVNTE